MSCKCFVWWRIWRRMWMKSCEILRKWLEHILFYYLGSLEEWLNNAQRGSIRPLWRNWNWTFTNVPQKPWLSYFHFVDFSRCMSSSVCWLLLPYLVIFNFCDSRRAICLPHWHLLRLFVQCLSAKVSYYWCWQSICTAHLEGKELRVLIFGASGSVVVKTLGYKPAGRGFDSRWCHWNFSVT